MSNSEYKRRVLVNGEEVTFEDLKACFYRKKPMIVRAVQMTSPFEVETLEGRMKGNQYDWLIEGVNGELYPCSNEVFFKTYQWYNGLEWIDMSELDDAVRV